MKMIRIWTFGGAVATIEVDGKKVLILSGVDVARLAGAIDAVLRRGEPDREFVLTDVNGDVWTAQVCAEAVHLTSGVSTPTPPPHPRRFVELNPELALELARGIDRGIWGM